MAQDAPLERQNPKRYLLMKSGWEVNVLWLDEHGSCSHSDFDGNLFPTQFHMKRDPQGRTYALRCPNSLSQSEWSRTFVDDPPGSWMAQFASYREGPPKRSSVEES